MPRLIIYIGDAQPRCPICHKNASRLDINKQFFECRNLECTVNGFLVGSDWKLLYIWLGKKTSKKPKKEVKKDTKPITIEDLTRDYDVIFPPKREIIDKIQLWNHAH